MIAFERYEQVLIVDNFSALFSVGDTITQAGISAIITQINADDSYIRTRPFSYYGFDDTSFTHKGTTYDIIAAERDYTSDQFGKNAEMESKHCSQRAVFLKLKFLTLVLDTLTEKQYFLQMITD